MVVSIGSKSAEINGGQNSAGKSHRDENRIDIVQLSNVVDVSFSHGIDLDRKLTDHPAAHVDVVHGTVMEHRNILPVKDHTTQTRQ